MKAFGIVGYSGSGKTTLLCALIPYLREAGLQVAAIKATHHDIDWDQPGKDSYRLREAGAEAVLLQGPERCFVVRRSPRHWRTTLDLLGTGLDLVLVEGNKDWPIPKIEVHRPALGRGLWAEQDPQVIAVASDGPLTGPAADTLPRLDLNDPPAIGRYLLTSMGWRITEEP
ncbi:MAG: molybdopterin-guanine dinucleotide biosynthesis protein B [Acidithiobacillus sp.]